MIERVKIVIVGLLLLSCENRLQEVSFDKFVGLWEVKGRGMFEGIQIRIEKSDDKLVGKIEKLNDNRMVNMFAKAGDTWISDIKRSSNFEFRLTEKKIASELFSVYGLSTSQEYRVQFIDDQTIGLGTESSDPQQSPVRYLRIE